MTSIVNVGVVEGDGQGRRLGSNVVSLGVRYIRLSLQSFREGKSILGVMCAGLVLYFGFRTLQALWSPEP